jgi:hypothetical protein
MVREVIQRVTDDLDGSPDAAQIEFALDGHTYTIDLAPRNEAKLRDALAPFLEHASKVRAEPRRRGSAGGQAPARTTDRERNQAIRAWALENGVELATRGRIATGVVEAFDDQDVAALFAAAGLEYEAEPETDAETEERPRRSRRKTADVEFSGG